MSEVPEHERQYIPDVFDALRALTVDAPGTRMKRDELGEAVCRWLIAHNRPTPPKGAFNRIMKRAGHPCRNALVRGIQLRKH
ncbi:hypothetical protein TPA0910_15590 [Streptomyces hygroscopicus subsp. sporocinereus]|uniref:Uncharacterized protein n=1 Tax=Streptomyces hygroscopicus TaxID=1912 RepID=A0ABQ3TW13_STRHY|nr:hypothetical protein TPA0910_15590 [Streptomyces hygroscopicus]